MSSSICGSRDSRTARDLLAAGARPSNADLHAILTEGDDTDRELLADFLLRRCRRIVRRLFPRVDPAFVNEAVGDAICKIWRSPEAFPEKASLCTFLSHIAANRVRDLLRREGSRRQAEASAAKELATVYASPMIVDDGPSKRLRQILAAIPRDRQERLLLAARLDGVFRTAELATWLGCSHLSKAEQKRVVKRLTDRLYQRTRRVLAKRRRLPVA